MTLFWKKGYHATSLKDLEAALQMKPGSIYAAFSSKEALFLEALARYYDTSRSAFLREMAKAASPLTGVAEHIRAYARVPATHPRAQACMLFKTLIDTRATDPAIAEQSRHYLAGMREAMAEVFARAVAAGELPADTDPRRLARRLQACVMALRFELHQGIEDADLAALAEDMAQEFERLRVSPR